MFLAKEFRQIVIVKVNCNRVHDVVEEDEEYPDFELVE